MSSHTTHLTRDQILADARFNTDNEGGPDHEPTWTALDSIDDLDCYRAITHPDCIELLDDPEEHKRLATEIAAGLTFAFYYIDGKLCWER